LKFAVPLIIAVGFVTCSKQVKLSERGQRVELVSHESLGKYPDRCTELESFDVVASASEVSKDPRYDALDIKAMNEGARRDATHVLRWPDSEFSCDYTGTPDEDGKLVCRRGAVTPYQCLIGRSH
jgi:hypothetical protein